MPGPPGIATLEMPRQPHELSKSASTSNTSPCQARWRITRIRASTLIIDPSCLSGQRRPTGAGVGGTGPGITSGPGGGGGIGTCGACKPIGGSTGYSSYAFGVRAGFAALTTEGRYRDHP